MSNIAKT